MPDTPVSDAYDPAIEPLIAGSTAVFAQRGSVYELALASGQRLWSSGGGESLVGMWRWRGVVATLTDDQGTDVQLTGLDAATGAIRWTLPLPGLGVVGGQVATADGGLAMVRADGTLEVVSIATGAVRWSRPSGSWLSVSELGSEASSDIDGLATNADGQGLTAVGGVLIAVGDFATIGYDDRTGRRLWEIGTQQLALPDQPQQVFADGDVVLAGISAGAAQYNTLFAIEPASGRIAWRALVPPVPYLQAEAGPAGLAIDTGSGMYLLDPRTGGRRWWADDGIELVGADDVLTVAYGESDRLVDRNAADGRARWSVPVGEFSQSVMVGGLALLRDPVLPALDAYRLSTGALAWRLPFPGLGYSILLAPVPGGVLVQALGFSCPLP